MGRVGACGDNAVMESFVSLLQKYVLTGGGNGKSHVCKSLTGNERSYHRQRGLGKFTSIGYEMITNVALAA